MQSALKRYLAFVLFAKCWRRAATPSTTRLNQRRVALPRVAEALVNQHRDRWQRADRLPRRLTADGHGPDATAATTAPAPPPIPRGDEKHSFPDTLQDRRVPRPADVENPRPKTTTEYIRAHRYFDAVLFGYARVSTADQNPDHQIDALTRAGVAPTDIYIGHASGAKASRPQLDTLLRTLRDGDTLKITRLDRLGRSVLHLVTLGAELRERGIGLHVTEQGIDTTTAEGRAMFGMLSVLAELQRELIVANTRDGLAAARARGRTGGRPPKLNPDQIALAQQLYDAGERTVHRSLTSSTSPAPPSTGTSTASAPASNAPPRRAPPTPRRAEHPPRIAISSTNGGW